MLRPRPASISAASRSSPIASAQPLTKFVDRRLLVLPAHAAAIRACTLGRAENPGCLVCAVERSGGLGEQVERRKHFGRELMLDRDRERLMGEPLSVARLSVTERGGREIAACGGADQRVGEAPVRDLGGQSRVVGRRGQISRRELDPRKDAQTERLSVRTAGPACRSLPPACLASAASTRCAAEIRAASISPVHAPT